MTVEKENSLDGRGMEFILHIWDDQDFKIKTEKDNYGDSFQLINYLTHKKHIKIMERLNFINYIESF